MATELPTASWQVLLVEDIYDDVRVLSKILSHHQVQVVVAKHGRECLEILKTYLPTVIMMDLSLPEMDGWETLRAIRANPSPTISRLPVIAITAYHSHDVAEDVQAAGFDAFIPKPVDSQTLIQTLTSIVQSSSVS
jgi:CheY-like chemotaxis protein